MERFANPFLKHWVADIANNHAEKFVRRAGSLLDKMRAAHHRIHMPWLERLMVDVPRSGSFAPVLGF